MVSRASGLLGKPEVPRRSYKACAWFKTELGSSGQARLAVNYWDERPDGTLVYLKSTKQSSVLRGTHDWTQLCKATTAPAEADYLRVASSASPSTTMTCPPPKPNVPSSCAIWHSSPGWRRPL